MRYLHKFTTLALLASAASLTLADCGGRGVNSSQSQSTAQPTVQPAPQPQPLSPRFAAEGFWGGPVVIAGGADPYSKQVSFWDASATAGNHVALVVLRTGETWIIYISGGVITLAGHGQTQATGSRVTVNQWDQASNQYQQTQIAGSNVTIDAITSFNPPWTFDGGYSGYVVPQSRLVLSPGNLSSGDSGGAAPSMNLPTLYDSRYDQPALPSQLAGTYAGTGGTYYSLPASAVTAGTMTPNGATVPAAFSTLSNSYAITISSTGAVTLPPDLLGCSGTGTATPRTDGNVFNLSLQFSGAKCALGNGAKANGIAVVENGHLLMMAVPPGTPPAGEFVFVSK